MTFKLSPRERECVTLSAQGATHQEMAVSLSISPRTARFHVENAKKKLEARNMPHLVAIAIRGGWIANGQEPQR